MVASSACEQTAVRCRSEQDGTRRGEVGPGIEIAGGADGMAQCGGIDILCRIDVDPTDQLQQLARLRQAVGSSGIDRLALQMRENPRCGRCLPRPTSRRGIVAWRKLMWQSDPALRYRFERKHRQHLTCQQALLGGLPSTAQVTQPWASQRCLGKAFIRRRILNTLLGIGTTA